MNCAECRDTGSLSKELWGYLDCPHCDSAVERAGLNNWASREVPDVDLIDAWLIYQHGKAAVGQPA